jgi:hypothetical protein
MGTGTVVLIAENWDEAGRPDLAALNVIDGAVTIEWSARRFYTPKSAQFLMLVRADTLADQSNLPSSTHVFNDGQRWQSRYRKLHTVCARFC